MIGLQARAADFTDAGLSATDTDSADLVHATLDLAEVTSANLQNANVSGAPVNRTRVAGINLNEAFATAPSVSASLANTTGSNFLSTDLKRAQLSHQLPRSPNNVGERDTLPAVGEGLLIRGSVLDIHPLGRELHQRTLPRSRTHRRPQPRISRQRRHTLGHRTR
jgi:hypothetical protein